MTARENFLREAIETMRSKLDGASLANIALAVRIVGELHQIAKMVDTDEGPELEGEIVVEAEGGRGEEGDEPESVGDATH